MKFFWPDLLSFEEISRKALEIFVFKGLKLLLIVVISYLFYQLSSWLIKKTVALQLRGKKESSVQKIVARKRALTLSTLLTNLLKYLVFFIAGFEVATQILGIKAAPIVASASIVGLAIGFGAQSLVKDFVSGFFILFENQYAVGDFVTIKAAGMEATGIVEEFGLRSTTIRDLSGNLHYIPNGNINGIDKYPRGYVSYLIELTLPVKIEKTKVISMVERWSKEIVLSQPLVIAPPKLNEIVAVEKGKTLVRLDLAVVSSDDWLVEKSGQILAQKLKESLKLKEDIPFIYYPFNLKVLDKHKKTIVIK